MNKIFTNLFFTFLIANTSMAASPGKMDPVKCMMSHPMVTGASISAGLDGFSFAEQLATKYGAQKRLIREAYPGVAGSEVITYPSFERGVHAASFVMALDFFYWDQFKCEEGETQALKTVDQLFEKTVKKGIPLVVGLLGKGEGAFHKIRFDSKCGGAINQRLKQSCAESPNKCLLVNMGDLLKRMDEHYSPKVAGKSVQEKKEYAKEHITRDGVHPRTDAYSVMAEFLDQIIKASSLECK